MPTGQIAWNKGMKKVYSLKHSGQFKKGFVPWNKNKKGIMPEPWNKNKHPEYMIGNKFGFQKGHIPWNKDTKGIMKAWNKKAKIELICPICQRSFFIKPSHRNLRKTCSQKCFRIWQSIRLKQLYSNSQNHPSWKNGSSKIEKSIRHLEEYNLWRKVIFERDNYTCQKCFRRGNELHPHHRKPFSEILGKFLQEYNQFSVIDDRATLIRLAITYKPFWDVSNGETLCKDCHKETNNYAVNFKYLTKEEEKC